MANNCLATYKYIWCMLRLPGYREYQLEELQMILRKLDIYLYNINEVILWLAQRWPEIQPYLLTGNIYLMGQEPLEALSSRDASFEAEIAQAEGSDIAGDEITKDSQQEEEVEEHIFNAIGIGNQTSAKSRDIHMNRFEDKSNSR